MAASDRPSKSAQDRREAQREQLRKQRQAELSRQRTVRTVVIAAITVVALLVVGGIGYGVYRATRPAGPVAVPAGMSADQPYLSFGAPADSGKPVVELHLDFMCPVCGQFEEINGEDLARIIENEEATVRIVPRRFLDSASTTGDYSSRAANAFVSLYEEDPAKALAFQALMFENQPAENSAGLTDEQIWAFAQEAGASDAVKENMDAGTYEPWVQRVADKYGAETGGYTPYLLIDGTEFKGWQEPGALAEAVQAAGSGSAASDAGGASDGGEG